MKKVCARARAWNQFTHEYPCSGGVAPSTLVMGRGRETAHHLTSTHVVGCGREDVALDKLDRELLIS